MITTMFLDNPNYVEYVRLLIKLHSLIAQGKSELEEAEAIRDQMDTPWDKLSPQEIERVDGISSDLYMLNGEEIFRQVLPIERSREWLAPEIEKAWRHEDWETMLSLLRNGPDFLSSEQIASLRATSYDQLGHSDIAVLFYDYIAKLDPANLNYQFMALSLLAELDRMDEATKRAHKLINKRKADPIGIFQAAYILCLSTRTMSRREARPLLKQVVLALAAAIDRYKQVPRSEDSISLLTIAYVSLGLCYEGLDRPIEAIKSYNDSLEINPNNPNVLVMRGILQISANPEAATADFERAVAGDTEAVTPYVFLAHRALTHKDYRKALQLTQRALQLAQRSETIARLLAWEAIAQDELGAPPEVVHNLFQEALSRDPQSEEIHHNFEIFRRFRGTAMTQVNKAWETSEPSHEFVRPEAKIPIALIKPRRRLDEYGYVS